MCCSGFLKMMMFIFNGGIFLAGAAILGVGIWVKVDSGSLLGVLDSVEGAPSELSQLANISYMLIGVGAVLVVIGFLGCCGAIRESRCMLLTFFSIVLILFIIEVAGAVVLLVFQGLADQLLQGLEDGIRKDLTEKYGENEGVTSLWDTTMDQLKCCGGKNYTDFDQSPYFNQNQVYPDTCCNATIPEGQCNENRASAIMVDGCIDKIVQLLEDNAVIVAAVALGITALEIAAMVVSMVLYKNIGNKG
ncbi:tetraspanin 34a [Pagrus major]|uniref:tetraspanin 34a n=1 Tax=Pagrus major TaxID=143350 RepID=UPI003CC8DC24